MCARPVCFKFLACSANTLKSRVVVSEDVFYSDFNLNQSIEAEDSDKKKILINTITKHTLILYN
jgi:hypothetical protein